MYMYIYIYIYVYIYIYIYIYIYRIGFLRYLIKELAVQSGVDLVPSAREGFLKGIVSESPASFEITQVRGEVGPVISDTVVLVVVV